MIGPFVRALDGAVELDLQVVPRASKEGLGPRHGDRLKLRVSAAPVDGAANEAVRALLSALFAVPRAQVQLLRGETGRRKTVRVAGPPQALLQRLQQLLGDSE